MDERPRGNLVMPLCFLEDPKVRDEDPHRMLEFPATASQLHVRQHDAGRVLQRAHGRTEHTRELFDAIARAALANEDKRPPHRMTVSAGLPVPRFGPGPSIVCRVGARAWIHGRGDDCRLVVQKKTQFSVLHGRPPVGSLVMQVPVWLSTKHLFVYLVL